MGGLIQRLGLEWRPPRPPRLPRPSEEQLLDGAFVAGFALIVIGCAWIYFPAGPIVAGVLLVRTAWRAARPAAEPQAPDRVVERWYSDDGEDDS